MRKYGKGSGAGRLYLFPPAPSHCRWVFPRVLCPPPPLQEPGRLRKDNKFIPLIVFHVTLFYDNNREIVICLKVEKGREILLEITISKSEMMFFLSFSFCHISFN